VVAAAAALMLIKRRNLRGAGTHKKCFPGGAKAAADGAAGAASAATLDGLTARLRQKSKGVSVFAKGGKTITIVVHLAVKPVCQANDRLGELTQPYPICLFFSSLADNPQLYAQVPTKVSLGQSQ
jgi:predicted component of type VI protein secretion system